MEDRRFDALTRAFARGTSRRTAIKGLFGGVVGGVAIATRLDRAGAQDACGGCPAERPLCCPDIEGGTCTTTCCSDADCGGDFCLFIGGDPHNSICVDCVVDEDCGTPPDSCTAFHCVEGVCTVEGGCPAGDLCCPAQGGSCAPCCDDGDCPAGTPICYIPGDPTDAICVQCVDASDCAQPDACTLAACNDYICNTASACPAGETCCDVDGVGIDCVNLNVPDDQYCGACGVVCGPCESCVSGVCTANECCSDVDCDCCEICSQGQCMPAAGECCTPQGDACGGLGLCDCCEGLHCCDGGDLGVCSECCYDADCDDCEVCGQDGACHPLVCLLGEVCCEGECVPEDECCKGPGDYCGLLEVTSAWDGSPQFDCCDGLVCCENWNSQGSVCAECCNDWDCPKGAFCHEGWCEYPHECKSDWECPKGTCCCKDGTCSGKCCDHHHPHPKPKPPKPAPPAPAKPVTTLPATGAGDSKETTGFYGAAALGAAAAYLAAKKLRETPEAPAEE